MEKDKYTPDLTEIFAADYMAKLTPGSYVDYSHLLRIVKKHNDGQEERVVLCLLPDAEKCSHCTAFLLCGAPIK